ncbi:MAG: YciI family protein [Steroidobacteraceae bacterium]
MQYMLLIYGDEKRWGEMSETEIQQTMEAYVDFSKALAASGALRGGSELSSVSTATTVRVRNGKALATDGPFAETKEQLGGYYLIDVPNLDEAIKWAARVPSALDGSIEIRPQTQNQAVARAS